jgi:hypothetical protein
MSDIRLKENIERIGQLQNGLGLYRWTWTDEAADLVGDQPAVGVIAQEVQEVMPDAVLIGDHGYMMVDYARVL